MLDWRFEIFMALVRLGFIGFRVLRSRSGGSGRFAGFGGFRTLRLLVQCWARRSLSAYLHMAAYKA